MRSVLVFFIRGYQYLISPLLGPHCRFYPTCSSYALESLQRHGVMKGGWLTVKRISCCHPWHEGGDDPVPDLQELKEKEDVNDGMCNRAKCRSCK